MTTENNNERTNDRDQPASPVKTGSLVFFGTSVTKLVLPISLELMPLKVIVVGAGIGGLSAALSLRQAGHDVQVG